MKFDRYVVKVSEDNKHAFNRTFRTRKLAVEFCDRICRTTRWAVELIDLKPINLGRIVADNSDPNEENPLNLPL
jgi:hypothetical protein